MSVTVFDCVQEWAYNKLVESFGPDEYEEIDVYFSTTEDGDAVLCINFLRKNGTIDFIDVSVEEKSIPEVLEMIGYQ